MIYFFIPLLGAIPTLSLVIPDDSTAQRVFHLASDDANIQPFRERVYPVVKDSVQKLDSLLQELVPSGPKTTVRDDSWNAASSVEGLQFYDSNGWTEQLEEPDDLASMGGHHHHHKDHHDHPPPHDPSGPHEDSSLLDLISSCKHSSGFYRYIKEIKPLADLLGDKSKNTTVFVPSNDAFDRLDKYRKHHDVSDEDLHKILQYHLIDGAHDFHDLIFHNTLLTLLPEEDLGKGKFQRLRIGPGPRVNMYSRIKMTDIYGANGVIHGVNHLLLPPPEIAKVVQLLPTIFSTSQAALARTGLTGELSKLSGQGGTVFLPTNWTWKKLGFAINAFLFSEHGKPYLKALMKYHVVPGQSLYSDALVIDDKKDGHALNEVDDPSGLTHGYSHSSLSTLLDNKGISADINRFARFLSFRVNGMNSIVLSDGIAKNGVIQVPDHILIPPHSLSEHHDPPRMNGAGQENPAWISLDELKQLLEPIVQRDKMEEEL